ncbi:nucleotide-binding alpha-beta plait domain-containing protein [Tanacetum coccineum]
MVVISVVGGCDEYERASDAIEIIRLGKATHYRSTAMGNRSCLDKAVIVRILAGQLITVAAMADASSLSIVGLSLAPCERARAAPADNLIVYVILCKVLQELAQYGIEHIETIRVPEDIAYNKKVKAGDTKSKKKIKGFAFLEFSTRSKAAAAFQHLKKPDVVSIGYMWHDSQKIGMKRRRRRSVKTIMEINSLTNLPADILGTLDNSLEKEYSQSSDCCTNSSRTEGDNNRPRDHNVLQEGIYTVAQGDFGRYVKCISNYCPPLSKGLDSKVFGLSGIAKVAFYKGIGLWELVWGEQGSVLESDPKIVATRIRKAQAAAKRKAEKNRGSKGAGGSEGSSKRRKEKSSDHILFPPSLVDNLLEIPAHDSANTTTRPCEEHHDEHSGVLGHRDGNFNDDVDEEVGLEGPDSMLAPLRNGCHWNESIPTAATRLNNGKSTAQEETPMPGPLPKGVSFISPSFLKCFILRALLA